MMYLIQVNILLVVFYGVYQMLFVRDTFFTWRRIMLLLMGLMAVAIPMVDVGWWVSSHVENANLSEAYREMVLPTVTIMNTEGSFPWVRLLTIFYICGVVVLFLRMMWQLLIIIRMATTHERRMIEENKVVVMNVQSSPFSFFGWIFINPELHSTVQLHEIMIHERAHVRQCHSLDMILMECLTIFCWWNPIVWFMRREVRLNLEYLADEQVVELGSPRRSYQYHLLRLAYDRNVATISNNFNVLPLKLRIKMMNKRRTNKWLRVKYLLIVPVAAAALVACNLDKHPNSTTENEGEEKPDTIAVAVDRQLGVDTVAVEGSPSDGYFDSVEQMPEFPGGSVEMMKFLQNTVKYPKEAQYKGIQGKVLVQFVVKSDGTVADAKVVNSVDPLLDAEALRVVKAMPKWKPGMQSGKAVDVKYNVPISFRLNRSTLSLPAI